MPPFGRWVLLTLVATPAVVATGASLAAAASPKVPDVVVDPSAVEAAPRVEAPIAEVTVYSDRARIRRRGRANLKAGAAVIRFPDLPGAAFLDTVRLSASGARVLRVEAVPVQRERFAIDQARKLLDDLDGVNDRLVALDDRAALDDWMASVVTGLTPAPPVPEDKREGRKALAIDVPSWWKALDFVGERATSARVRTTRLVDERRELTEKRDRLLADIAVLNQGGFSTRVVEVTAVLEAAAGPADVQLEYFVPGARWKPTYDLHFASARGQLRVETAAVVDQTTGEDWTAATLLLSTAMPGRGIDLPELLTWTLGERSDFIPRSRPSQPPRTEAPLPSAGPQSASKAEVARVVDEQLLRERLARALASEPPAQTLAHGQGTFGQPTRDGVPRPETTARREKKAYPAPHPMPSAPSGVPSAAPAAAPMEMNESEVTEESISMPSRALRMVAKKLSSSSRGDSVSSVPLALFDTTVARRAPVLSDPTLPAVSAGGLDYVYEAPTPATIPSTGRQVRIPLASQAFRTSAFYEATPALATTAFLRARVRNDGKRPLLRGPVAIFGDGELVGVGEIQTTGPGGDIEFPLGADQDIRLVRQVVPSTKTTGLIMKSEETTYDVQIQVGNYKKQPAAIEVIDQVPMSRRDKVEVKLLATDPAPLGAPDADGVLRWRIDLPAGGTRTVRLRYQITRPKGWVLFQR